MTAQAFASARDDVARRPGLTGPGRRAALTALSDEWLTAGFATATASSLEPS